MNGLAESPKFSTPSQPLPEGWRRSLDFPQSCKPIQMRKKPSALQHIEQGRCLADRSPFASSRIRI